MPKNWGTYAQWIVIGLILIGTVFTFDHRLTTMEAQKTQEFDGYAILFASIRDKVDTMDKRMQLRFDRIEGIRPKCATSINTLLHQYLPPKKLDNPKLPNCDAIGLIALI